MNLEVAYMLTVFWAKLCLRNILTKNNSSKEIERLLVHQDCTRWDIPRPATLTILDLVPSMYSLR